MKKPNPNKKAISPIIATLLLILIAIAAGVVVYAYVIGFVGNSTVNSGSSTNSLTIDQLALSTSATKSTATVYLRNLGPSSEQFNTGFYIKGSSLNMQLSPAVAITTSSSYFTAITSVTLGYTNPTTISVSIAGLACSVSGGTLSISGFGIAAASISPTTCPASAGTITASITLPANYAITSTFQATETVSASSMPSGFQPATIIVGTPITAGTISVPINSVLTLPLTESGLQVSGTAGTNEFNNPLSPGQTYTVQLTGVDGGSATASAKAS